MSDGQASISADILSRYAADAANEVTGARALAGRKRPRIESDETGLRVELHLEVGWGRSIPEVGRAVQARVREYLGRMADVEPARVDVVVEAVGPAA
jgi:Asp23 family, cell envelope-related function